jgi:hypothetical protein
MRRIPRLCWESRVLGTLLGTSWAYRPLAVRVFMDIPNAVIGWRGIGLRHSVAVQARLIGRELLARR